MTIKLDVLLVQILHVIILLWIFRKIIGTSLTEALLDRKKKIHKLQHADEVYQEMITKAQEEANEIVKEGVQRKEALIAEGSQLAQKKYDQILADAEHKAQRMVEEAMLKAESLQRELKDSYVEGVKKTAQLVVNKIFQDDVSLQDTYLQKLVEEFKDRS